MTKRIISPVLAFIIIFLFCACTEETSNPENEILNYTVSGDPTTLDPQIAEDLPGVILVTNLFEGLVRADEQGEIIPGMAKSWDISDDGLRYTFYLEENTCWSNGAKVTAHDFVFGLTRALSPQTNSSSASDLFAIKNASAFYSGEATEDELGVRALDDFTLEIDLEYETNSFLIALTEPVAMPCNEEFFNTTKGKYGKDYDLIITNGPFEIRENYGWDHEQYIYIRRSDDYNGANKSIPAGVNFNFGEQPGDPVSAVSSGETDLCEIFGSQLTSAEEQGLNITTTTNTLWGICFNTDIKAFKNAKLRVSLFGSLDRESLLKNAPNSYVKTSQLIGDDVLYAGKNYRQAAGDHVLSPTENPSSMFAAAKEELAENEIELQTSYTIIYLDDSTSSELVTSVIETWNNVTGCYFNKEPLNRAELESRLASGDYDIAIAPLNTAIYSPMEFFSKFTKASPNNYINLNYPSYDEFISSALLSDGDEAIAALAQAEEYLVDYGYLYPLYYESRYFATASNVSGVIFSAVSEAVDFTQVTKLSEE